MIRQTPEDILEGKEFERSEASFSEFESLFVNRSATLAMRRLEKRIIPAHGSTALLRHAAFHRTEIAPWPFSSFEMLDHL